MAKKKKVVKKSDTIEVEDTKIEEEKIDEVRYLSSDDLLLMEKASLNAENRSLEMKLHRSYVDRARKEQNLISANYTLKTKEIEELELKLRELERVHKTRLEEHRKYVSKLKVKLNINSDSWGYDHESGEIKE